jgi:hypothetical protein
LYGEFWPWVDGVTIGYRTRGSGVSALVRASVGLHLGSPG